MTSSDKALEPLRQCNEALLQEAFKHFVDLPKEVQALAVDRSIAGQAMHAAKHYRNHLDNAKVVAALHDGSPGDVESVIQETLAEWFVKDFRNERGLMYIELGLQPMFDCSRVDLGKPTSFEEHFKTEAADLKTEKRKGTMLEYAAKTGRWDCVRLWLRACADQLTDEVLCSVNSCVAASKAEAGDLKNAQHLEDVQRTVIALVGAGVGCLAPVWEFGKGECAMFVEESLKGSWNRQRVRTTLQRIQSRLNSDLNESIVGNHGPRSVRQSLVCLVLGATLGSTGLSWHQGGFYDICPQWDEKGVEYQEARSGPRPDISDETDSDDPEDVGFPDPNVWIAAYYEQYELARLMVEMGAPTGIARAYGFDFVVFTELCIEDRKATLSGLAKEGQESEVSREDHQQHQRERELSVTQLIRDMEQFREWLLEFEKHGHLADS
eukprot:CAMPEP_0203843630 /NCGR_PEP_ID=MMETSP0359-20131031/2695_1 /ASSEMBLY_ACC=CAM_ASM_000338 /TAXON_ID=268821 /ORGANISM="Scrippsiella Hangoei, Strain SHTV-5" /LENGTH=436 /DNA_ID=CAMNT_0050758411 /DNA_START=41 /DNA_END=1351 /DNA_ORIENTATION=-